MNGTGVFGAQLNIYGGNYLAIFANDIRRRYSTGF